MTDVPDGWVVARLGEIAETRLGKMLSSKAKTGVGARVYLRNKNVQWGRFDLDDVARMDFTAEEFRRFEVVPGDLLVCEGGEVGRAAVWRGELDSVAYQKALHRVRPHDGVVPEFLRFAFTWLAHRNAFDPFVTGSTIKHLPQEGLRRVPVPLPSTREQHEIVSALEDYFSRIAVAQSLLWRSNARMHIARSALLRAAFDLAWPRVRIGDVAYVGSGATPSRSRAEYWTDGTVPWVTSGQLTEPFVRAPAALISQLALRETSVKLWPKHTLLVALYGEGKTRGHCSELLIDATTNQACAAIQLHDESIDRSFLRFFFAASYESNRSLASGGVQPNLSLGFIRNLRFPVPPLEEQRAIVARLEHQLSLLESLRSTAAASIDRGDGLSKSILQKAFSGALVRHGSAAGSTEPSWRRDSPNLIQVGLLTGATE